MGETAATAVVSIQQCDDGSTAESTDVQFEVFQLSDQAVRLWKDGWFQPHEKGTGSSCTLRNPKASTPVGLHPVSEPRLCLNQAVNPDGCIL